MSSFWFSPTLSARFDTPQGFNQVMALEGQVFREQKGRKTLRFSHHGHTYFAKLHKTHLLKNTELFKALLRARLPILSARVEARALKAMAREGIPTMTLVGEGTRTSLNATQESFIITEAIEPSICLEQWCHLARKQNFPIQQKHQLIRTLATIARQFHQAGFVHHDFYLCHFLLAGCAHTSTDLRIIDCHRVKRYRRLGQAQRVRDLGALLFSSLDLPLTSRDSYRFVKHYFDLPLKQCLKQHHHLLQRIAQRAAQLYRKIHGRDVYTRYGLIHGSARTLPFALQYLALIFQPKANAIGCDTHSDFYCHTEDEQRYWVKRYYNAGSGLQSYVNRSPLQADIDCITTLRHLGITCMQLVSVAEQKRGQRFKRGVLIMQHRPSAKAPLHPVADAALTWEQLLLGTTPTTAPHNTTPVATLRQYTPGERLEDSWLTLRAPYPPIQLQHVLRVVAGKRTVIRGHWQQQPVIIKLFYSRFRGHTRCAREVGGLMALQQHTQAAPALLYHGKLTDPMPAHSVITAFIDAPTFAHALHTAHVAQQQALMTRLLTAFMHNLNQGIVYRDCHFNNFLVDAQRIIFLDGDTVKKASKPATQRCHIQQISHVLAQLSPRLCHQLYPNLAQDFPLLDQHRTSILTTTQRLVRQRMRQYLQKCKRSASAHVYARSASLRFAVKRDYQTAFSTQWLANCDAHFATAQVLKRGNSSTVIRTQCAGIDCVIKRYNIKTPWHWLKRLFRPTRARLAWLHAHLLEAHDIASITPIAFVERRRFWLLPRNSYIIYRYYPGQRVSELLASPKLCSAKASQLIQSMAAQIQAMGEAMISHGDLKAANFLVDNDGNCALIDLDGMRWHSRRRTFLRAQAADYQRFRRNKVDYPHCSAHFDAIRPLQSAP